MDRAAVLAADIACLLHHNISHGAIVAYTLMFLRGRILTDAELALEMGRSDRQARRYLRELEVAWSETSLLNEIHQRTDFDQTNTTNITSRADGRGPLQPATLFHEEARQAADILGLGKDGQGRIQRAAALVVQQLGGFYVKGALVEAAKAVAAAPHRIRRSVVGYLGGTLRNILQDIRDRERICARMPRRAERDARRRRNADPRSIELLYKVINGEMTWLEYCRTLHPEIPLRAAR